MEEGLKNKDTSDHKKKLKLIAKHVLWGEIGIKNWLKSIIFQVSSFPVCVFAKSYNVIWLLKSKYYSCIPNV